MKFSDITPENKLYIVKCIETALRRLCINTRVMLGADKDDDPRFESEPIQTTPAMFDTIKVKGGGEIRDTDNPNLFNLYIEMSYRYEHFDGGSNGANIGTLQFIISNRDGWQDINFKGLFIRFYVEKNIDI